jgi:hypothetical protein
VILWRRVAGGFTAGQQNALYQDAWNRLKPILGASSVGGQPWNTNVVSELLRLLGSLERLQLKDKSVLAQGALAALTRKKLQSLRPALLWMLGRVGARAPVYASLQETVPAERTTPWVEQLLGMPPKDWEGMEGSLSLALMQMARRTGDRYRDLPAPLRQRVLDRMETIGAPETHRRLVAEIGTLDEENTASIVGDSLPLGFVLREARPLPR